MKYFVAIQKIKNGVIMILLANSKDNPEAETKEGEEQVFTVLGPPLG